MIQRDQECVWSLLQEEWRRGGSSCNEWEGRGDNFRTPQNVEITPEHLPACLPLAPQGLSVDMVGWMMGEPPSHALP